MFRLRQAGDSALVVEFEERIDPALNARVIAVARAIERSQHDGVRDVVPTYCSLTVYFDPLRTRVDRLVDDLQAHACLEGDAPEEDRPPTLVPVCYGGEYGPDLEAVARFAQCSAGEAIALHTAETYRVYMLGFVPGFSYMGSVNPRIAIPRHATPRVQVPAGSVGIAGRQTGVYPAATPGGWHLVGRTPLVPFDPARAEPFLFKAGDRVRFQPISCEEYKKLADSRGVRL